MPEVTLKAVRAFQQEKPGQQVVGRVWMDGLPNVADCRVWCGSGPDHAAAAGSTEWASGSPSWGKMLSWELRNESMLVAFVQSVGVCREMARRAAGETNSKQLPSLNCNTMIAGKPPLDGREITPVMVFPMIELACVFTVFLHTSFA